MVAKLFLLKPPKYLRKAENNKNRITFEFRGQAKPTTINKKLIKLSKAYLGIMKWVPRLSKVTW